MSGPGNVLELHDDNPRRWDAWDLDIEHRDSFVTVAFDRRFGDSILEQSITLEAGSRVLRFETTADWHERHKMLKVSFPVTVSAREATYEVHVDTPQVVVEAIKRAEDSDAVIVRLYEAWGRSCKARIRTTLPAARAFLCDLLERDREEVAMHDGVIELELNPFKVTTLKLVP